MIPHPGDDILHALALDQPGNPERAARLLGAADAQQEISGVAMQSPDLQDVLPILEAVRQALGEEAFQEAWEAGREMTTEEAFNYALSDPSAVQA